MKHILNYARIILAFAIISSVLASCDRMRACSEDADCGYSCTYGCVSAAWYSDKEETEECSKALSCVCTTGKCEESSG